MIINDKPMYELSNLTTDNIMNTNTETTLSGTLDLQLNETMQSTGTFFNSQIQDYSNAESNNRPTQNLIESLVIILQPFVECSEKCFSNSLQVFRLLEDSVINKSIIIDTYRNLRKKIQVFKLKDRQ